MAEDKMIHEIDNPMIEEITWDEFQNTGLLWYINTILQPFGLSIALEVDGIDGPILDAYPVKTKFRGFSEEIIDASCEKMATYMKEFTKKEELK
jgi:hypothetical protein